MSGSKSYTLMLEFSEGGTTTPIPWSKDALKPESIIFVIDERTGILWFWVGKQNSLVKRRTAMRQADSLKGHGYQVGKSFIGRGVSQIVEIDDRKVGREDESTQNSQKFLKLFEESFQVAMDQVVVLGQQGGPVSSAAIAPEPAARPGPPPTVKSTPSPVSTPKASPVPHATPAAPVPQPAPEGVEEEEEPAPESIASKSRLEAPKIVIPAKAPVDESESGGESDKGLLKLGLVVMAVISQVPDVYVSKKSDNSIEIESMDGVICRCKRTGSDVQFSPDSFSKLDPAKAKIVRDLFLSKSKSI